MDAPGTAVRGQNMTAGGRPSPRRTSSDYLLAAGSTEIAKASV